MKNRTELMADMIVKADWLIMSPKTDHYGNYSSEYKTAFDEYCRLRDELAEVKERSAVTWNDVKERYLEFHKMDSFTENMAIDIDFGYWLVNQFAAQSQRMSTEEVKKIIDETTEAHPYRQRGKPETYTDYNQGWEDACDILGNRIMELLTK